MNGTGSGRCGMRGDGEWEMWNERGRGVGGVE